MQETVKDASGNIYEIVTINGKKWMAANLKTTKLNDGTNLDYYKASDFLQAEGHYNIYGYYDEKVANFNEYGAIYPFYAVEKGGICPEGWHVANKADWNHLIETAGGENEAALKLMSKTGWKDYNGNNVAGLDTYGFAAKPGGYRLNHNYQGQDEDATRHTSWWSEDRNAPVDITSSDILFDNDEAHYTLGAYIRCVKD